jgi:cytochrome P450
VLISAGNDTTASFVGNCLVLLDRHPAERARLWRDPRLLPNAIEEMLRYETPTQLLSRTALRDVERHGVRIPAGSLVHLLWGAANHDEREFADPGRLDLGRRIERHLAFGHGIHYCIGANLARLEARVALEEWLARFPDYALAGEPERLVSFWARAWERIPVRLA